MRKITTCNWWGYINLRLKFRRKCLIRGQRYIEKYKRPNRYLYCKSHRAVLVKYGNNWEIQQPVYVSSFCDTYRCVFKGTCDKCKHNLNNC